MQDSYFWNILFLHCPFPTHPRYCTSGLRDYNDDWSGGGNIANWSHGRGDLDTWPCQGLVRTLWTGLKQFFRRISDMKNYWSWDWMIFVGGSWAPFLGHFLPFPPLPQYLRRFFLTKKVNLWPRQGPHLTSISKWVGAPDYLWPHHPLIASRLPDPVFGW